MEEDEQEHIGLSENIIGRRWNRAASDVHEDENVEQVYERLYDNCVGWHPRFESRLKQFKEILDEEKYIHFIKRQDIAGNTLLHLSCLHGVQPTVRLLLDAEADVGTKNKIGLTPFMVAIRSCEPDIAMICLSVSPYPKHKRKSETKRRIPNLNECTHAIKTLATRCTKEDSWKRLALDYVFKAEELYFGLDEVLREIMFWLMLQPREFEEGFYVLCLMMDKRLEKGLVQEWGKYTVYTRPHKKAMFSLAEVAYCIQSKVILSLMRHRNADIRRERPPLNLGVYIATLRGDMKRLKFFVRQGGMINRAHPAFRNCTPLHITASRGMVDLSMYLLENMADCLLENSDDRLPADLALMNNYSNLYRILRTQEELQRLTAPPPEIVTKTKLLVFPGTLFLEILEVTDLVEYGWIDKFIFGAAPRAFCICEWNRTKVGRSHTVEGGMNPHWDDLMFPVRLYHATDTVVLKLFFEPDDFLGSLPVRIKNLKSEVLGAIITVPFHLQTVQEEVISYGHLRCMYLSDKDKALGLPPLGQEKKDALERAAADWEKEEESSSESELDFEAKDVLLMEHHKEEKGVFLRGAADWE